MEKPINNFGIDVQTEDVKKLIGKLNRLTTTVDIGNAGMYHQDKGYSIVWINTKLTKDELEDWLYNYSHCNYVGVFNFNQERN